MVGRAQGRVQRAVRFVVPTEALAQAPAQEADRVDQRVPGQVHLGPAERLRAGRDARQAPAAGAGLCLCPGWQVSAIGCQRSACVLAQAQPLKQPCLASWRTQDAPQVS